MIHSTSNILVSFLVGFKREEQENSVREKELVSGHGIKYTHFQKVQGEQYWRANILICLKFLVVFLTSGTPILNYPLPCFEETKSMNVGYNDEKNGRVSSSRNNSIVRILPFSFPFPYSFRSSGNVPLQSERERGC